MTHLTPPPVDWCSPDAQSRKQKLLDALVVPCDCERKKNPQTGKPRRGCSCAKQVRTILRALDSFQQKHSLCWPSVETIAARVGCSERNARRLLRIAEKTGFIATARNSNATSHYTIN